MSEHRAGLPILAFTDAEALHRWLETQPESSPGVWIKFAKAGSEFPTVTKAEALATAVNGGGRAILRRMLRTMTPAQRYQTP